MHMMPGGRGPMRNVTEPKADNNGDSRGPVWTFSEGSTVMGSS